MDIKSVNLWDSRKGEIPRGFEGLQFRYIEEDTVGSSSGNAWGYVSKVEKSNIMKIKPQYNAVTGPGYGERAALLKYSDPEYKDITLNEWLYSEIAKLLLEEVKIPDISRAITNGEKCLLSYSLLDRPSEQELYHIGDILSYKLGDPKKEQKGYISFGIRDIIQSVLYMADDCEEPETLIRGIVLTTILDCITNSVDRHGENWGVIRDFVNKRYSLMVVDNSLAFINIIDYKPGIINLNGYPDSVVGIKSIKGNIGCNNQDMLIFIQKEYPQYFDIMGRRMRKNMNRISELCSMAESELGGHTHISPTIIGRCNKVINFEYAQRGEFQYE